MIWTGPASPSVCPEAEQKRIVSKLNELMTLCDALEAKLTQSRAAAVVHQLAGAGNAV